MYIISVYQASASKLSVGRAQPDTHSKAGRKKKKSARSILLFTYHVQVMRSTRLWRHLIVSILIRNKIWVCQHRFSHRVQLHIFGTHQFRILECVIYSVLINLGHFTGIFYLLLFIRAVPYRIVRDISVRFLRMISMRYHTSIYT